MRICVLSSEPRHNACARLRLADILPHIGKPVDLDWFNIELALVDIDRVCAAIGEADVIIIQRSFPRQETMALLEDMIITASKPLIYETDDLLTALPDSHPEAAVYARHTPIITALMVNCDIVVVSTPALQKTYLELYDDVAVFPNTLDRSLWYMPFVERRTNNDTGRPIRIGFCGSHTHLPDLQAIEPALLRVVERFGDRVNLCFVGCVTEPLKRLPGTSFSGNFVHYADYPRLIRSLDLDIGLAPLCDTNFNSHKSHVKYLEYAACGIPGIYSQLTAYANTVVHRQTGLLVPQDSDAWYEAIATFIEDRELANRIASNAYQDVWSRFAADMAASEWNGILERADLRFHMRSSSHSRTRRQLALAMWRQMRTYEHKLASNNTTRHDDTSQMPNVHTAWRRIFNQLFGKTVN